MRRLIALLLLVPAFALAQSYDALRAQIRADLMQDPRAAAMSPTEFDALVEALAGEAESNGTAETYLDAQSAPTYVYDAPPIENQSPFVAILTAPIVVAILAFLIALAGVLIFMLKHRRQALGGSDLQNS